MAVPESFDGIILVADDDVQIGKLIKKALEVEGFEVMVVTNGEEAMTAARHPRVKLIIMDALMPKVNGFEASEKIKKSLNPQVAIILLTAVYRQTRFKLKAKKEWGIDSFMTKPFDINELISEVKRLLRFPGYA
ncbi:MAG: response regulator [Gemmatimonadetes bacterium]|nr:MAG: response regulator [Gemmatimonadota bacterium]